MTAAHPRRARLRGLSWSAAYLVVTRASAVAAVPLVLHGLGTDLYGAWVLAGTLIMAQGLIDVGAGTATVRFAAMGSAAGSRRAVRSVLVRSAIFYATLSALVAGGLLVEARPLVRTIPYLRDQVDEGAALVRYVAIAFALTNASLVLSSLLQGIGRVDAAFRGQTIGWLLYLPALAAGLSVRTDVDAVGVAWLIAYGAQVVLLGWDTARAVKAVPDGNSPSPGWREFLTVGGRWQVSSWADFATFQLPRIAGGLSLGSAGLLALDLAMRGAQIVVAPFFAAYPLVLPAAAQVWEREGGAGLARRLARWTPPVMAMTILAACLAIPLLPPALAAWTGRPLGTIRVDVTAAVVLGTAAHAATGLASSVLLAAGELRPIVRYKVAQLGLAVVLVTGGAAWGTLPLAAGLAVACAAPAWWFLAAAERSLGAAEVRVRVGGALGAQAVIAGLVTGAVVLATASQGAWVALGSGACVALAAGAFVATRSGVVALLPVLRSSRGALP